MPGNIQYPLLLDGGLSNQLESQGCDIRSSLWTAELLESDPQQIIDAHLAYLKAGAACIITASYQATIQGFKALGIKQESAETLIIKSVQLAREAIEQFMKGNLSGNKPLIAASNGPYGAFLADGSEYRGNYGIPHQELFDFHTRKIELLDGSDADLLACETIPDFEEAAVLSEILTGCQKHSWMTFSCKDREHLHDGTPIEKCVQMVADHPKVFAVGVNCTHPGYVSDLIRRIVAVGTTKKIVVYPNSGETYYADSGSWSGNISSGFSDDLIKEWLDLGVDIIGGCCRIGPVEISRIQRHLQKRFES